MIVSLVAFALPFILLFLVDVQTFLVTAAYLYGLVVCYRVLLRQRVTIDAVLCAVYVGIALAAMGTRIERFVPFTGTAVYAAIALLSLVGTLTRPWTLPARTELTKERVLVHRVGNGMLFFGNAVACWCSVALFPRLSYILVPIIITVATAAASFLLPGMIIDLGAHLRSLIFMDRNTRAAFREEFGNVRGLCIATDRLLAKEVVTGREEEQFFGVLERAYLPLLQNPADSIGAGRTGLGGRLRSEYRRHNLHSTSIVVYDRKFRRAVGCIRLVSSHRSSDLLPMEHFLPITLRPLRRRARRIAEVGRLAIICPPTERARVLELLVQLIMIKALFLRVRLLCTDALESSLALYKKMGLSQIGGPYLDMEFRRPSYLCVSDIAAILAGSSIAPWERMKRSRLAEITIRHYLRTIRLGINFRRLFGARYLAIGGTLDVSPLEVRS